MIIQEQQKDMFIVGEDTSKKATISADKMAKLQYLLTKGLYKDPITAVIAEWTNNAIDSIVEAGKNPVENPVLVYIGLNDKNQYIFSVEDKGTGLDSWDFENICMNYLESTKEGNNDTIGHFGIGLKSFLSLERSATFTCRKNGIERIYNVYEGAEFVNYDLILEKPTDEGNGVKAEITLIDQWENKRFIEKATQKLAYYDTVILKTGDKIVENTIFRSDNFQWSNQNSNDTMHLCLKDVYYRIDWEALGINDVRIPIALRFSLSDGITPTPSRESYITNESTKTLIINKIKEVAEWFVNKYNEVVVKEFDTFKDGYNLYGLATYTLPLEGKEFIINPLISYTSVKINEYKVKGLSLKDPSFYKSRREYFFHDYSTVAKKESYYSGWRTKNTYGNVFQNIISNNKVVLIDHPFTGYVRDYLKEKYNERESLIIRKTDSSRKLWNRSNYSYGTYEYVLGLDRKKKGEWRSLINEWLFVENQLREEIIDETNLLNSQEFISFVERKREEIKARRKRGEYVAGYETLNKQSGEVTLAYSYNSLRGISFKKKTYKIETLSRNPFLTILVSPDDNITIVKELCKLYKNNDHIRFAQVGNLEIKKVPNKQFIKFKNFMSRDCKPFMRLASAILFNNVIDDFKKLKNKNNQPFIEKILKKYIDIEMDLKSYVKQNLTDVLEDDTETMILNVAYEKDLFDKSLWDKYLQLKEATQKYDFITLFDTPSSYNTEAIKSYQKVITQILLFRKKYYNEFPENAVIIFEEPKPEIVEEEQIEDEGEFDVNAETTEEDFDTDNEVEFVEEDELETI